MPKARDNYTVTGSTVEELSRSLNFLLQRFADRMDKIEGIRGTAAMDSDLDMNGHRAVDLGEGSSPTDSVRMGDLPTFDNGLSVTGTLTVDGEIDLTGDLTVRGVLDVMTGPIKVFDSAGNLIHSLE
jgi:hypothetical protein